MRVVDIFPYHHANLETPNNYNQAIGLEHALLSTESPLQHPLLEHATDEFLATIEAWHYDPVEATHESAGLGAAYAYFGIPQSPQEIFEATQAQLGNEVPFANAGGFTTIYDIDADLTPKQYVLVEATVVRDLVGRSLRPFKKDIPDLFLTGTSLPTLPLFHHQIASFLGISDMRQVPPAFERACDSAGSALYALLSGNYDHLLLELYPQLADPTSKPIVATVAAWEDGRRLKHRGGDPTSAQLFSTAAGVVSLYYHPTAPEKSSLVQVAGVQFAKEEGVECLRYLDTTQHWTAEEKATVHKPPFMKPTDNGMAVQMDGIATALYFKRNVTELLKKGLVALQQEIETTTGNALPTEQVAALVSQVAMHHPSVTMGTAVRKVAAGTNNKPGLGYSADALGWHVTNGNAPSVMVLAALTEILKKNAWDDTRLLQFLSYGAGGSFTTQFVRKGIRKD